MNIIKKEKHKISWVGLPAGFPSSLIDDDNSGNGSSPSPSLSSSQQLQHSSSTLSSTSTTSDIFSQETEISSSQSTPNPLPNSNSSNGLDRNQTYYQSLEKQKSDTLDRIATKKQTLKDLEAQEKLYHSLITRNTAYEQRKDPVVNNKITLPFIVVNTKNTTVINCDVSEHRAKYFFNFTQPFEIHDDNELLRKLNLYHPNQLVATTTTPTLQQQPQQTTTTTTTTTSTTQPKKKRKKNDNQHEDI